MRDLDARLGVLTWIAGLQLAVVLAVPWRLFALRGEVSALGADTTARLGAVEQRLGGSPARPPAGPDAP